MSLSILGGRGYFWQWDTGQQLLVQDTTCGEVHFCNGTDDCALVVPIKTTGDGARVADVPNILLQTAKPVSAYLYHRQDNGAETRTLYRFQVLARSKPEDYVYTETEVLTYHALEQRVSDLEKAGVSPDQIAAAVENYLQENPVKQFETDETLTLSPEGVLSVNRAEVVEQNNTLPITSAAVYETVGNINALLATI